jgi:hypothetical protein
VGSAGAAHSAVAGPHVSSPLPKNELPKDPTSWSVAQVQQWFSEHKGGKWQEHADKFAKLSGKELCDMEKGDLILALCRQQPARRHHLQQLCQAQEPSCVTVELGEKLVVRGRYRTCFASSTCCNIMCAGVDMLQHVICH